MLYVIGIGPGDPDYILPAALKTAAGCPVLVGGKRALALFPDGQQERFLVTGDLDGLRNFLQQRLREGKDVAVLVSGDPGFYSLLGFLRKNFSAEKLQVIPGISSLQLAFARAGLAWQQAELSSVHGRSITEVNPDPGALLGLLTGKDNPPRKIAAHLLAQGPNRRVLLANNLSYPDELCFETDLQTLTRDDAPYDNAVILVMPAEEDS